MSLKAKLEAVIYAAEEPVTLAQLAALFADDAFEWKAQQEAASAEQAVETAQSLPLVNDEFACLEPDSAPPDPASVFAEQAEQVAEAQLEFNPETSPDSSPEPDAVAAAESGSADLVGALDAEAELEARRLARLRDREVRAILRPLLDELIASCASDDRGVEIREIAGGYRMATKPECHDTVRLFIKSIKQPLKLSLPALETLAVIAYKQPVTAPEVNEIRGVDTSGVFGTLLSRKLITTAGRKAVLGRPILYKTTREFLLRFGLRDVSELPSMEEFEKLAASELDEPESATGDLFEQKASPAQDPEFDEAASEELEDSPDEDMEFEPEPQTNSPESITTAETAAGN
ncbi:MAG: SMC-Scp complex subunit ScpB [Terracidiphilus sp.]|jgi:segregation and condensation protein B